MSPEPGAHIQVPGGVPAGAQQEVFLSPLGEHFVLEPAPDPLPGYRAHWHVSAPILTYKVSATYRVQVITTRSLPWEGRNSHPCTGVSSLWPSQRRWEEEVPCPSHPKRGHQRSSLTWLVSSACVKCHASAGSLQKHFKSCIEQGVAKGSVALAQQITKPSLTHRNWYRSHQAGSEPGTS